MSADRSSRVPSEQPPSEQPAAATVDRTRGTLPRELLSVIRRDPQHLPEHLTRIAQERLAQPSLEWAEQARTRHPNAHTSELAEQVRTSAAHFARTNGALAGTPFLIALVPAYVSVLWEQARMIMRIAALNGRDPRAPEFAAEILALRGLYETPHAAQDALARLASAPPPTPTGIRNRFASWVRLAYRILIFAGFVSAPEEGVNKAKRSRIVRALSIALALVVYWITWVVPVTFMIAMSWSCESDTRTLGHRTVLYYGDQRIRREPGLRPGRLKTSTRGSRRRALVRITLIAISLGIPLGLITLAVADPIHHSNLVAIGGFLGLVIVIALSARAAKR